MPTNIEWTNETWNPITGCALASEGCRNCYAARLAATRMKNHPSRKGLARRNAAGEAKFTGEVRFNEEWLTQPLRWRKPRTVFPVAHGDLFHEGVPDEWIDKVFAVTALCPQHTFQVLTKRPERMRAYFARYGRGWDIAAQMNEIAGTSSALLDIPLPNVWLGVSVEDQATADARIPVLLDTPAALRWISAEPLLGPVRLPGLYPVGDDDGIVTTPSLDWVVCGGESGRKARPMHPDWARRLRDQCAAAEVPFFFKQWGEWAAGQHPEWIGRKRSIIMAADGTVTENGPDAEWPDDGHGALLYKVGKKAAGRMLDGVLHDAMPEPVAQEAL